MSDLNIGDHISHRFNEELESIRSKVMTMGGLVEKQVQDGLSALIDNDRELAELVSASDVKLSNFDFPPRSIAGYERHFDHHKLRISALVNQRACSRTGSLVIPRTRVEYRRSGWPVTSTLAKRL